MDHVIGRLDEIPDGGMKSFEVAGLCILVSRDGGHVSAVGGHCTHQGAPLAEGLRIGNEVICPWHHARFDLTSGEHLAPPGQGRLAVFPVRVEDGAMIVTISGEAREQRPETDLLPQQPGSGEIVIVGSGAAGLAAAEELRRQHFHGHIHMISMEADRPYDRTELSKGLLIGEKSAAGIELASDAALNRLGVVQSFGRAVSRIDAAARRIVFADGESQRYDTCLVATGCAPRDPNIPGSDARGVLFLRSRADGLALKAASDQARAIVIIGAGFIGMEAAAVFAQLQKPVTVVTPAALPFAKVLGQDVAQVLTATHRSAGAHILTNASVSSIEQTGGRVSAVRLASGEALPADLVLIATGARPRTDLLQGVAHAADGGVHVDETLKAADGLWAAGDIAAFPSVFAPGERARIEHWRVAQQLGRHAARAMLGSHAPFAGVPFFWTQQHWQLSVIGLTTGFDRVEICGDLAGGDFTAFYMRAGQVVAGAGAGGGDQTLPLHALFHAGGPFAAGLLEATGWDAGKLLHDRHGRAA